MNTNRSVALPFYLAGLGTGVAVALLFAPRTGTATRKLIGRKVRNSEEWVEDQAGAAKKWVLTQGAGLRDRVSDVAEVITRS
jgi:gas vesicle protein